MAWDVSIATYENKSVSVNAQEITPYSVTFSSDGTKMYIVGINSDRVYQYTLTTAWDVSTATYASKNKGVSTEDTAPRDIVFNSDGTIMYMVGDIGGGDVYQYSLSTAWDVSTATYASKSVSVQTQDSLPRGIFFNPDGTKMYMVGDNTDTVYQYTLSTAWDVSTATYASKLKSVSAQDTYPCDVDFSPTGTKMYIMGNVNDTVYQYTLTTAWDVSTATYANKSVSVNAQESYPLGFAFSSDGTEMYIVGSGNDTVYQYTLIVPPTVTTQAVTDVGDVTATGNGNITALGGDTPTKRGICYNTTGTPTVADSKVEEIGEFGTGAFTETLINLSPETHYYVRAYAMNAAGYGYGGVVEFTTRLVEYIGYGEGDEGGADSDGWVKFITAAEGVVPTGTRKVICSDYSGFTYRTQASETDDGAEYVAYFVISTDLTNKKGLSYYKLVLDLHLYFKNEISGTAKVEVKRDSEPAWQEVGEVTLTGVEEILIKHLATKIRAKHYLFKLSATDKFKFLGCLYEFIREGDR